MAVEQESHRLEGSDAHGRNYAIDPATFIDGQHELRHQLTIYLSNAAMSTGIGIPSGQPVQRKDAPGTPIEQISTQSHGRPVILRSVSSRFVEDLPEFQPYSPTASSPHRRRFRSSSAILGKGSRANNVSATKTTSGSNDVGNSHQITAALQDSVTPAVQVSNERQSRRRWETLLLVSAYLSIVALITNSGAHSSSPGLQLAEATQCHSESRQKRLNSHAEGFSSQNAASTTAGSTVNRNPLKLKKRHPSQIQNEALRSRRESTYREWRREMKSEVSANVSRRSSQRSQKSAASRVTRSTVCTKCTSRRRLLQTRRRCNGLLRFGRRCSRILGCCGGCAP